MYNPKNFISPEDLTVDSGYKDYLGKGAFGKVFRCCRQGTASAVAVKMFDITGSRDMVENTLQLMREELEMLLYLQESPRVVNLIGVTRVDDCMFGLVMEYLPRGSLFDLVRKLNIPWTIAARIMCETATGLSFLHEVKFDKRVTHNDLKPENILFDEKFHVKLCDFGGSNLAVHSSGKLSRNQGTPSDVYSINYVAPEYFNNSCAARTRAMDVYSYGMILYFVLSRKPAFYKFDSATIQYFLVTGVTPKFDEKIVLSSASDSTEKELIAVLLSLQTRCSDFDPTNRPRIHAVESELKSIIGQVDEADMQVMEQNLIGKVPILQEGLAENRIKLNEKCKSIFAKKLQIPFDDDFSDALLNRRPNPAFATGQSKLELAFCRSKEIEEKPSVKNDFSAFSHIKSPTDNVKATSSSSEVAFNDVENGGNVWGQPGASRIRGNCSPATNVITIDVDGHRLRNGDKFIIQSRNKLLSCIVVDAYKKEGI